MDKEIRKILIDFAGKERYFSSEKDNKHFDKELNEVMKKIKAIIDKYRPEPISRFELRMENFIRKIKADGNKGMERG